jgi:hypothetical protein
MRCLAVLSLVGTSLGIGLANAAPASAGGIGGFLSPAFGTNCANHSTTESTGDTIHGSGAANGLLASVPVSNPSNQCGGADVIFPQYFPI